VGVRVQVYQCMCVSKSVVWYCALCIVCCVLYMRDRECVRACVRASVHPASRTGENRSWRGSGGRSGAAGAAALLQAVRACAWPHDPASARACRPRGAPGGALGRPAAPPPAPLCPRTATGSPPAWGGGGLEGGGRAWLKTTTEREGCVRTATGSPPNWEGSLKGGAKRGRGVQARGGARG
jgi:hypothetical protein